MSNPWDQDEEVAAAPWDADEEVAPTKDSSRRGAVSALSGRGFDRVRGRPSTAEILMRGAFQGGTAEFGDEAGGAGTAALQAGANILPQRLADRLNLSQASPVDAYRFSRDEHRTANAEAQRASPAAYLGANLVGSMAIPLPGGQAAAGTKLGGRLLRSLAQGGLVGGTVAAGASDADLTRGEFGQFAADTGVGIGTGALVSGGAEALASGAGALHGKARAGFSKAQQEIDNLAKASAGEATQAARTAAGTSATAAYKNATNIDEAIKAGAMTLEDLTPEQLGLYRDLLRERAQKAAKDLVADAARKSEKATAFAEAAAQEPQRLAEAAKYHGNPLNQLMPRLKRYGMPALGTIIGTAIGGPLGGSVGALAGAGSRPMMQSLLKGAKHPSVERELWRLLGGAAAAGARAAPAARASTAPATRLERALMELRPAFATEDEEELRRLAEVEP